jgi:hypothetical protein
LSDTEVNETKNRVVLKKTIKEGGINVRSGRN